MTATVYFEIKVREDRQAEIKRELDQIELELISFRGLKVAVEMHPDLATLTEFKSGANDDKVIADAVQEAEDNLVKPREPIPAIFGDGVTDDTVAIKNLINDGYDKPGEERKPLHFFMAVSKADNRIGVSNYDSYNDCHGAIGDNFRVGEFVEVMPENHVDKDYFWRNIFKTYGSPDFRVGLPHDSLREAREIVKIDDFFDTVKIRRNKKC